MDPQEMEREARPLAIRLAKEAVAFGNARSHPAAYSGLVASIALQNVLVSIAVEIHAPGSPEGEAWLRETYEAVVKSAVERWHKSDLKERFGPGGTHEQR